MPAYTVLTRSCQPVWFITREPSVNGGPHPNGAAAGTAEENREVVPDQLAATAGEDGRKVGEARPLLLASLGGEPSDAAAVRVDGTPDRVAARPFRVGEQANRAAAG